MTAAIDTDLLNPVLTDGRWVQEFALYGANLADPLSVAPGSKFSLVFAPQGRRQPASGQVYEITTDLGHFAFAGNLITATVPQAFLSGWASGEFVTELRDVTDPANPDPLHIGGVFVARGLSQLAAMGGGAPWPGGVAPGVNVLRTLVRVLRGEAAGSAAIALAAASVLVLQRAANQALSGQKAVRELSNGKIDYASAAIVADAGAVLGLTQVAVAAGGTARVQTCGELVDPSWSWTPGPVYLGLAGGLTQTPPAAAFIQRIGWATAADRLVIKLDPPILTP